MSGFTKTFESKETFKAYHLAEEFCQTNGISFGASCAVGPTALLFGEHQIAKWRNLTTEEQKKVHGIIRGDMRTGPVRVYIKPEFVHLLSSNE
jgi:hypothetical protein